MANDSSDFIHLHNHSHYSLLYALPKIPDLVTKAKSFGMDALALTDNGNLYGAIEFYKECKSQGIKPILGVDFYIAVRTRMDKEARIDNRRTRLVLLAKDNVGYRNLIKLVTYSNFDGFYYKPRIDRELIEKYKDGLVCIVPSISGDIPVHLKNGNTDSAEESASFYKKMFGDDFYLEVTHHPEIENHDETMKKLRSFAETEKIEIVAAHDTYYLDKDDKAARNTLVSIQNEFSERNFTEDESDFSFIDQKTAEKFFRSTPRAIANCKVISDKCNLELNLGKWLFPEFKLPTGVTPDDELENLVKNGAKKRDIIIDEKINKRVNYELGYH